MNEQSDDQRARASKLAEIRRQIYEGTYETPSRLAQAVERFLDRHEPDGRHEFSAGEPFGN